MIFGAHVIVYSRDADADQPSSGIVLGYRSVDAGHGWLIRSALGRAAVHPTDGDGSDELYLMCDDLAGKCGCLTPKVSVARRSRKRAGARWPSAPAPRRRDRRPVPAQAPSPLDPA